MSMSQTAAGTGVVVDETSGKVKKAPLSEGARAERNLGWMLCAPAVIVMLAVTAYPVVYAIILSLQRYNLELPQAVKFIGFSNYAAVLSSPYWWQALKVTVIITVFSVSITLVLGMLLALLMHRTLFGRGTVRTAALIPYGIVTVAAAYGWQYAWTPGQGYLSAAFNNGAPLTTEKPAILVALLFRTLDSFRIFDNIFILTNGANNTGSVSTVGYDNLFNALNLGIGSTISILIFICVAIIAFTFIKLFGTAAPGTNTGSR
jgi:multiple sugar transport system permease protein